MNIVFLTTDDIHHLYFINEIHKVYPVKKVFFQKLAHRKTGYIRKLKNLANPDKLKRYARALVRSLVLGWEGPLQKNYESRKFFNGQAPALTPAIPFEFIGSFNDPEVVQKIARENPELILVFGTEILKGPILKTARLDTLNIHRGILPHYRGGAVDLWALYNKDFSKLGTTVHVCTDQLDGGPIVGQKIYQLSHDDRVYTLRYKTTLLAVDILKEVIPKYEDRSVNYNKQGAATTWKSKNMTIAKELSARWNLMQYNSRGRHHE